MGRPTLEVADIFRAFGPAWRWSQREHLSLGQLKVMSAIEQCRSAALGGHVLLQFLPQSPLPEVSGQGGTALVGSPSGRPASGGVLRDLTKIRSNCYHKPESYEATDLYALME
ncbi:hypothetical protein Bcep1808_7208 (plasmid) [Burkholderia vietnamiensis G4]|uniref:Uncharacterized protein n=1 Tax=Burkholderia vietnamiensis (strain G4 / LMG 22486) TaxID=269482 RepID=A4JUY5_BURVG|nr:hypothetical protein Bcep1808_7208 [Burkholderia vietnamiensis G4]